MENIMEDMVKVEAEIEEVEELGVVYVVLVAQKLVWTVQKNRVS